MRAAFLLPLAALVMATNAPVAVEAPSLDARLAAARKEAAEATKRLEQLQAAAGKATSDAERLSSERLAAAASIEETESKLAAAEVEWRAAKARLAVGEARLATQRAPLAALLAGLVTMGRQPPLLALTEGGGADEIVRVKALLDATQPVIEQRTAQLRGHVAAQQRLAAQAASARRQMAQGLAELEQRRTQFAALESKALAKAQELAGQSIVAGDRVLAVGGEVERAEHDRGTRRHALAMAAELAAMGMAPPRPFAGDAGAPASKFAFELPIDAPLLEGLGSIDQAGVMSRGLRFDSVRGASVKAPADGKILFAAPYRGQDGLVIIDHGEGRTSVLLNVSGDVAKGERVTAGQPIGRALGPVGVEYREKAVPKSPAFIAASSAALSNARKDR